MVRKKTLGEIAAPLLAEEPCSRDPIEIQRVINTDEKYKDSLTECAQEFRKNHKGNFYVVVLTKTEPLLPNVLRNYFFARISCPTPDYDQSVYRFTYEDENLIYIWTIPSREACHYLLNNSSLVAPEERNLLQFVIQFANGTLGKLCKQLNGEREDSVLLST